MHNLSEQNFDVFMSVRQLSQYLHLNEKKIYSLVNDGQIPATKVTGKWMFPRELIDKWMLDSTHNGLLHDRLLIAGSDDPLLYRLVLQYGQSLGNKALVSYHPSGTRQGLELLNANRIDACCIHWGPYDESTRRHPSLIQQYSKHHDWVLIRACKREQGFIYDGSRFNHAADISELIDPKARWCLRQPGSGALRFLMETLSQHGMNTDLLQQTDIALSERQAASSIILKQADVTTGTRAVANEYGLDFLPIGWQALDFAIPRNIWFRHLFQNLIRSLKSDVTQKLAFNLGGYDFEQCGDMIWGDD